MNISAVWNAENICHTHRTRLPFYHLGQDYPEIEFQLSLEDIPPDTENLWLFGAYKMENVAEILKLKRDGVKIIAGLDDNYWDFPEWRADKPSNETMASVDILTTMADHVVVTTDALAKRVGQLHKTTVAPNLMEAAAYRLDSPPADDSQIRILWAGASGHKGDLDIIDDVCCEILKRSQTGAYGKNVQFVFVGHAPDKSMRDYLGNGVSYVRWVPLKEYWYTLNQIRPHITLAPLVDCAFNHSKSPIRLLEAFCLHSACIYSPVGEYKDKASHLVDAIQADSTDEWIATIERLINDKDLRYHLTANGWANVNENWNWRSEKARKMWHPTIDKIIEMNK